MLESHDAPDPSHDDVGAWSVPLPGSLRIVDVVPFAGRHREQNVLAAAWERAARGTGGMVVIGGEPGIGKSRLVAEFGRGLHSGGTPVLFAKADEYITVPFRLVSDVLNPLVGAVPIDVLENHAVEHGDRLAGVVPAFMRRVPGARRAPPGDDERIALLDAAVDLIARAAEAMPTMIVLDDIHWADESSTLFLRHLAKHLASMSALVVPTYRDTEISSRTPVAEMLADLRQQPNVERLPLSGLERSDVDRLMRLVAGPHLDETAVRLGDAVHADTDGNAYFVRELLRHLIESGALYEEGGRWRAHHTDLASLGVPAGVQEALGRRVASLSEVAEHALQSAAVIGEPFDIRTLADVVGDPIDEVGSTLDDAALRGLVDGMQDQPGRFRFSHPLVRQTLYEGLTPGQRERLHEMVLTVREREGAPKAELAHHAYMAIGRVGHGRAVSLAAEAGGAAAHSLAWNEAVTWYERAVAIDGERQLSDPRSRARLLIGLGRAMGEVGLEAEALVPLAEAAAAARVADDRNMLVEVALAYGAGGSVYADPSGAGLVIVDEALASLPPGPSRHRALLLVRRSEWVNIRDPDESRRLAEEALALADVLRDPALRLAALTAYTNAVVGFPGHDELDDIAEEMMALIPERATSGRAMPALFVKMSSLLRHGDLDGAALHVEVADRMGRQLQSRYVGFRSHTFRAIVALLRGDLDTSDREIEAAMGMSGGTPMWWMLSGAVHAQRLLLTAPEPDARAYVQQLVARAPGLAVIPADVHAALEAGDTRAANQLGRDWVNRRIGEDFPSARPWSLWMMSRVVGELEPDVAEGLHRWLLPYEAEWVVGTPESCFGSAQIHLGRAARAAGWLDEAVLRYTAAVKEHERVGEVPWRANALVELASTLRDRARSGDTERAARKQPPPPTWPSVTA